MDDSRHGPPIDGSDPGDHTGDRSDHPTSEGVSRHGRPSLAVLARGLVRDPVTLAALLVLLTIVVAAIVHPWILPYDHTTQSLRVRNLPPFSPGAGAGDPLHILGTDPLGRDMLARILSGARASLGVGFLSVLLSGVVGVSLGVVAGYYQGRVERLVMRLVDLQMSIPFLLMALVALFIFGTGLVNVIVVLALARWPLYARVAQGMTMSLRDTEFVDAARSIGGRDGWIIRGHILPNMLSPIVVLATLELSRLILAESTLSFLGVGIQPPDSSWGLMISQGRDAMIHNPWVVTLPGIAIFLSALSANLLATWARAVTDPVQRWEWLLGRQRKARR